MIKDVMPRFLLLTGLDGRRWEIIETDEGVHSHRKEGRAEWHPGLYRKPFLPTYCQTRKLEDRLLNSAPLKAHTDGTGLTVCFWVPPSTWQHVRGV
jgi:hypothetical protein